jgi:hypothetical protein
LFSQDEEKMGLEAVAILTKNESGKRPDAPGFSSQGVLNFVEMKKEPHPLI